MERRTDRLPLADPPVTRARRHDVRTFPGRHASVSDARRHVRAVLRAWHLGHLEQSGALLATELVTNAVLHARSDVRVELLDGGADVVVLVVGDDSPVLPVTRRHGRESGTGRGMWLLEHLSSDRGVRLTGSGKQVWAVLCPEVDGPGEGLGSRLAALLDERDAGPQPTV